MGYTHYYTVHSWDTLEWQQAWRQLLDETRLILEASDILLSGPTEDDAPITAPVVDEKEGIFVNGVADDSHEPFILSAEGGCFVKTLRKPYDLVVACVLLRAFMLAPDCVEVNSDGRWTDKEWIDAIALYKQLWPNEQIMCPWGEEFEERRPGIVLSGRQTDSSATADPLSRSIKGLELASPPLLPTTKATRSTLKDLDLDPISNWLATCDHDSEHAACRAKPIVWQQLPGVSLKMIDVERKCIVEAPEPCSFVALTYVWGNTNQPKLTAQTAPVLMQEGGLDTIWPDIPTTIRDAILLCRNLGERYLWVDALCIKQDSIREMKIQILRMRQIYAAAKCTIAAVSAESADVGLLGTTVIDPPSSGISTCETVEDLEDLLESAPWSSRAWCYQEKVLSHRILMFTSGGVYMHCQRTILTATGTPLNRRDGTPSTSSTPQARFDSVGGMLSVPLGEDLESYVSAVEFYSKRHLTNLSDKQNAFQGIFKRYQGVVDDSPSAFSFGLPISAFDQTFCWRSRKYRLQSRNPAFPSWSWLGWQGGVEFDREMIHAARTNQMIYPETIWGRHEAYAASLDVRKPAVREMFKLEFGFPASATSMFSNNPKLYVNASTARARIVTDARSDDGESGLYAVWATSCRHHPPPPPPAPVRMTMWEILSQPLPKLKVADAETLAAPSLPGKLPHEPNDMISPCSEDGDCVAKTPLGYVWLDREWRAGQGEECVMDFMALAGRKDEELEGDWVITLLMCLQRMEKKGQLWGEERVQVLDCEIGEQKWLEAGAETKDLRLV
ncbi:hypothetical protein DPSP01_010888 [Paraphaeosphaeria sporulosa]